MLSLDETKCCLKTKALKKKVMQSLDSGLSTASHQIIISGVRCFSSLPPSSRNILTGGCNINLILDVSVLQMISLESAVIQISR